MEEKQVIKKSKIKCLLKTALILIAAAGIFIFVKSSIVNGTYKEPIRNFAVGCANYDISKITGTVPKEYLTAMEDSGIANGITANIITVSILNNTSMISKLKYKILSSDVCSEEEISKIEVDYAAIGAQIDISEARKLNIRWWYYTENERGRLEKQGPLTVFKMNGKWYIDTVGAWESSFGSETD